MANRAPIRFLLISLFSFALIASFSFIQSASAATLCFCHATGSPDNPFNTLCTSNSGQQNGHGNHGDPTFGCFCGDNVCDPSDGETCSTCPQDCGACPACGDGNADNGEDCGEPGLSACPVGESCEGCRCVPPPPECFTDADCDDGNACNGAELCDNTRNCVPGTPADSDGDGTADCIDGCPNDPNKIAPGVCGCGIADTDSDSDGTPDCNDGCPNEHDNRSLPPQRE